MKNLSPLVVAGFRKVWESLRLRVHLIVQPASSLQPLNQVRREDETFDGWISEGGEPQLLLKKELPLPGWHMLEVAIDHKEPRGAIRLYFDTGSGFIEQQSVYLPLNTRRIHKRVCYVPREVRAIRLDPLGIAGAFSFKHLRFVFIPSWFAYDRLSKRMVSINSRRRQMVKKEVIRQIKQQAKEAEMAWSVLLLREYEETFSRVSSWRSYQQWIEHVEHGREPSMDKVATLLEELHTRPLISVLVPVYNPRLEWLRACLDSVLAQSYSHWQLCIADDASTDEQVRQLLLSYSERDSRIEVIFRQENGHICAASNTALELVRGEYLALLDHDDRLAPNALYHVAEVLHSHADARVLYSDEDKLDDQGNRYDPHFKPDWNPDLLLNQNYISHLGVYQTDLVRQIGGFRQGLEGSQDHDLLLRCVAKVRPEQIVHIPHVLYHWRACEGSTALGSDEKAYTSVSGQRAVQDFLDEQNTGAKVEAGSLPNTYRVRWPLPDPAPMVSLMVPTRDGIDILQPCVDAILERTDYTNFELLILDNQSSCPRTLDYMSRVAEDPRVRVLRWDLPFNYSAINNFGVSRARGEIIGLVNNDIEPINSDWLDEMVRQTCREEIGCVGAKLYYPNDTIQHGGVILGIGGVAGHAHKNFSRNDPGYFSRLHLVQNLSAVTAACLLVRKAVFDEVGGLNEKHLPVAFNDVDLCLKVREAGYRNLWTPYAELYHHESVSRGVDDTYQKRQRAKKEVKYMRQRWGHLLSHDPAYNPNLTVMHDDFSLC